jgi:hypothetical protein
VKLNSAAAVALVEGNFVAKGYRRDERLDFVEAVLASTQNLQRKINLRRRENLHSLQFVLSFRAKSRNLLPLVGNIERCLQPSRKATAWQTTPLDMTGWT